MQSISEEEAKNKVCPFMTQGQVVTTIENGTTDGSEYEINTVNCMGSQCMAWKFKYCQDKGHSNNGYCKRLESCN